MAEGLELDLGQKMMAKLAVSQLMRFGRTQARKWGCGEDEIFISFKIKEGKPTAKVESLEYWADMTEKLNGLGEQGTEMVMEFLSLIDICADDWGVPTGELDMRLKMVKNKPQLAIEHKETNQLEVII